jgi:PIN like domain
MKSLFQSYYRPSEAEFRELWKNSLFSFDASTLLNLYHYSDQTRTRFLDILTNLGNRRFLTHQAALEYQRRRIKAICQELSHYDKMKTELERIDEILQSSSKHPFVESATSSAFHDLSKQLIEELDLGRKAQDQFLTKDDPILSKLTDLFDGCTGQPYPPDKRPDIEKVGAERYAKGIPPGFADLKGKQNDPTLDPYGDYIIWLQLLDKAKDHKAGIIFVTDDAKEDWWSKHEGRTIGPHRLLSEEMHAAGSPFYLYSGESFVNYAEKYLDLPVEPEVKRELKEAADERTRWRIAIVDRMKDDMRRSLGGRIVISPMMMNGTQPPFQDPDIMPTGAEVPVTTMRYAEFSQLGKMIDDFCEDMVLSPLDNDHLIPTLTVITQRLTLLKARWFEELPPNLQRHVLTLFKLADQIPGLPSEQRYQMVGLLQYNSERLVQAVAALAKPA